MQADQPVAEKEVQLQNQQQNGPKRQGSDLNQVQNQVRQELNQQTKSLPIQYGCMWGIQKFFDQKQALKHFKKHYKVYGQDDKNSVLKVQALLKGKGRNFYIVKFAQQSLEHLNMSFDEFHKRFSKIQKNKKYKLKALQHGMNLQQYKFYSTAQIEKPYGKNNHEATQQQIQQVKNQKIQDIVASLHSLPYQKQVQQKRRDLQKVIQVYNSQFFRDNQVLRLLQQKKQIPPLALNQFIQCPINKKRTEYRSKSQFTIGKSYNGQVVIGFNKGSYRNNTIMVQTPRNVNIISKSTKLVVAVIQNFIRTYKEADLQPFDRIKQVGFWRYLIVRQSDRTNQSMIIIVCKTQGVEEQAIKIVKQKLVDYCKMAIKGLKSLCFLNYNGQADSVPTQKPQILYGTGYYQQKIFEHTFQVSASAFLQINIPMCQVLYEKIIQAVKQCDVVLDLGSGIGTIGISIKNKLPNVKVIGIQICQQAVQDSKRNSPDYQVYLGKVEDHIKDVCQKHRGKRIIAILDPPRAGFNKDVLVALRRTRGLDNIIYVACNAKAIQDNLLQLTLPVTIRRKAPQFVIKKMLGFDLFPQTPHYEALYILQRT